MSDRELVINAVKDMPENVSMRDILISLKLLTSINEGLDDTRRGAVTAHEDVVKQFETWITKSSGRTAA